CCCSWLWLESPRWVTLPKAPSYCCNLWWQDLVSYTDSCVPRTRGFGDDQQGQDP
ncbi:unnamed protein product, partial [Ectocarpus sp. 13 AM-2016]